MNSPDQEIEDARLILGEYIEPHARDPARTVERLLAVLDNENLVHALDRMRRLRMLRVVD